VVAVTGGQSQLTGIGAGQCPDAEVRYIWISRVTNCRIRTLDHFDLTVPIENGLTFC
jgi:hypothetical protein